MIKQYAGSMLVGLLGLMAVSCRQSPSVVYQKSLTDAQTLIERGETNQAVVVLRELFDNKRFDEFRPHLLGLMFQFQLGAGDMAGAQRLFRDVAGHDPVLAGRMVGVIEGMLAGQGRYDELVAWCILLQGYKFEEGTVMILADHHFRALAAGGKMGQIPEALTAYLARLKEGAALSLAQGQFGAALGAGRSGDAEQIMAAVEKQVKDSPDRKGAVVGMKTDLLLAAGDRSAAAALLRKNLDLIPDHSAVRNAHVVVAAYLKAGDLDAADGLARFLLENAKTRTAVHEAGGAVWIKIAEQRSAIPELVKRLVALKELGFPNGFVLDQMDNVYAMLLDKGTKEDFGPLYGLCEGFYKGAGDRGLKQRLVGVLLDLGFYLEKFEESLKLAETGMEGSDPGQTALLIWKIKAHLALQKGQTEEAVKDFRAFMACVAKGTGYDFDPVDNTRVSKEMILGLNAKRIGDILAGAGDREEAAKAYAEARENYEVALKEFPDAQTKEHQKVQKQLGEVPGK